MSISIFISMMSLTLSWLKIKGEFTMKEIILSLAVSCASGVATEDIPNGCKIMLEYRFGFESRLPHYL